MPRRLCGLLLCLPLLAAAPPAEPAGPDDWDARVRYRIGAFGDARISQYREMLKTLSAAGFVRADEPSEIEAEDPKATRLTGTLPRRGVERASRQRHVRSVLLSPKGVALPEKDKRVRVEVFLDDGYAPAFQRDLAREAVAVLSAAPGFAEAVGYDHHGFTRLVGSVPAGNLDQLLDDPALLPNAKDQPLFRKLSGLRLVVARPDLPVPDARPASPNLPAEQAKFDPALRALLADEAAAGKGGRLEVVLGHTPSCRDRDWVAVVEKSGAVVEGRTGPLVSVAGVPKEIAPKLAALTEVVAVRLPRAARVGDGPRSPVPARWEPVRASGLAKLHSLGQRGRNVRVALVADDFDGWQSLKGRKEGKLPLPDPVLVDLTAARTADVRPDPYPSAGSKLGKGAGTRAAAALLRAAPEAQLTLVRIDAAAPYMLEEVARAIDGEDPSRGTSMGRRFREIQSARENLGLRREELTRLRREALADLGDEGEAKKRRDDYFAKQEAFDKEAAASNGREDRFDALQASLKQLRGVRIVASGLVWADGFPVDGSSALSRYFDDKPFGAALWFQAAGDVRGQAWAGLFRDADANGVMEFLDGRAALPRRAWTKEINFLTWQPHGGPVTPETPADVRVRLTLQWREPHDCLPLRVGEDLYREPLTKLKLVVVRQHDRGGKDRPRDDVEVVAESTALPQRLNQTLNAATWEHVVELKLPRAGRYGVFVEGKVPLTTQAKGEVRLPAQKRFGELHVRLFANVLAGDGRAAWDWATEAGSLGMPADSGRAVTVGAADADGRARPASASGPPYGLSLLAKPDVLSYEVGGGTAEAAGFAAGLAASSVAARESFATQAERSARRPGEVLRVGR